MFQELQKKYKKDIIQKIPTGFDASFLPENNLSLNLYKKTIIENHRNDIVISLYQLKFSNH